MSLIVYHNRLCYICQEKQEAFMLSIEDISVGDLIHVPLNGNHFLIMHKNDNREHLGCRLVKSDTTVDIDYDSVMEMIEHGKWVKVCG